MNNIAVQALIETHQQSTMLLTNKIDSLSNAIQSERVEQAQVKEACCKDCQPLFSGDVQNGFKFVPAEKPGKPAKNGKASEEMTAELTK